MALAFALASVIVTCASTPWGSASVSKRIDLAGYGTSTPDRAASVAAPAPDAARTFPISGSLHGLYPAAVLPLVLTVSNPFSFQIRVTSIATTVMAASSGCATGYFDVASFSGSLPITAGHTAKVTVMATMLHSAPNPCQGATFVLQYSGIAVKP